MQWTCLIEGMRNYLIFYFGNYCKQDLRSRDEKVWDRLEVILGGHQIHFFLGNYLDQFWHLSLKFSVWVWSDHCPILRPHLNLDQKKCGGWWSSKWRAFFRLIHWASIVVCDLEQLGKQVSSVATWRPYLGFWYTNLVWNILECLIPEMLKWFNIL